MPESTSKRTVLKAMLLKTATLSRSRVAETLLWWSHTFSALSFVPFVFICWIVS
jgi:hypothetical protein